MRGANPRQLILKGRGRVIMFRIFIQKARVQGDSRKNPNKDRFWEK